MINYELKEEIWRAQVGLFPMPLFHDKFINDKFVLLNGGISGNICLDFKDSNVLDAKNTAWSSDVGFYISINSNILTVQRWDTDFFTKYDASSVLSKLPSFYEHLRKQEINKQDSIVEYCISIYRRIRVMLRDNNGRDSINALLFLLSCIEEDNSDRNKLNLKKWRINNESKSAISSISSLQWDELYELMSSGMSNRGLKPNIYLLLRHASGNLFQEAHNEILFPNNYQYALPFFIPTVNKNIRIKGKKQTSAHYTPSSIVRTIVEESIEQFNFDNKNEVTVLDPACGSGEFLKEFIRQVRLKGYQGNVNIIGWDISDVSIDMANYILRYETLPYQESVKIKIENKDSLLDGKMWSVKADFVLTNPPFISYEMMNMEQRDNVIRILGDHTKKRPNTAAAFLWNSVQCLKKDGVLGCVLPTSIFENESYLKLRNELKDVLDIKIVGRIGSHTLFSETLVDTALMVAKYSAEKKQQPLVFWSDYKAESAASSLREVRKQKLNETKYEVNEKGYCLYIHKKLIFGENWMPIPKDSFELLEKYKAFSKVSDLFDIRQGVRTGMNSVFLIPKYYYEKLPTSEKKYFRPVITNESIQDGLLNDNYYIFYAEGDYSITDINNLKDSVPTYYNEWLKEKVSLLSQRARKGAHNFWRLSEHRAWQIEYLPKIVSTEFGSNNSFAFDVNGIYVTERGHAWLPKNKTEFNKLGYAYLAVLNMPIINVFLSGLSKQLGGGNYWYLSSKYLNNMPLPNLYDTKMYNSSIRKELINLGMQISNGRSADEDHLCFLSKHVFNE